MRIKLRYMFYTIISLAALSCTARRQEKIAFSPKDIIRMVPAYSPEEQLARLIQRNFPETASEKFVRYELPLYADYVLETVDSYHRVGSKLREAYHDYKKSGNTKDFWHWLEAQERTIERIVYFTDEERERCHITFHKGKIAHLPEPCPEKSGCDYLFILDAHDQFFLTIERVLPDKRRIAHTSLSRGEPVVAAGEMFVTERGEILRVKSSSGHYRPGEMQMIAALRALSEIYKVNLAPISITLRDRRCEVKGHATLVSCREKANARVWYTKHRHLLPQEPTSHALT